VIEEEKDLIHHSDIIKMMQQIDLGVAQGTRCVDATGLKMALEPVESQKQGKLVQGLKFNVIPSGSLRSAGSSNSGGPNISAFELPKLKRSSPSFTGKIR